MHRERGGGTYKVPHTSMEPEKRGLEDDFPFQTGDFQVPAVGFWGSNHISGTEIALRFKILGIRIYLQMDLEIQELIPT